MYMLNDEYNDKATLIKTIQMLGIDPMTMGSRCFQVMRSDLKRRFRTKGFHGTLEQIAKAGACRKYSKRLDCHTLYPGYD